MAVLVTQRQQMLDQFMNILAWEENKQTLASQLESGCYDAARASQRSIGGDIWERYSEVCYKFLWSWHRDHVAEDLVGRLLSGELDPRTIGAMLSADLDPTANGAIRDEIARRREQKITVTVCRLYRCPKCRYDKTTTREYQARSADEGSTVSIRCLNDECGHVWRIN